MNTEELFERFIKIQDGRVTAGIITKEYAKGYCFGYLSSHYDGKSVTDDEYSNISRVIEDTFN